MGNLFFNEQYLHSEKNGDILIRKILFFYQIIAGNCFQSGPYVDRIFKTLLKKIPKETKIKKTLLLGLGGGGAVKEIKKRFPATAITAIEYDPVMVDIAKSIYLKPKYLHNLNILLGNAKDLIPKLNEKYEIIIIDLFKGTSPSPILESDEFLKTTKSLLEKDGYLLINFYKDKETLSPIFDKLFSRWHDTQYFFNEMAVYRHFGRGHTGDLLPEGFVIKEQSLIDLKTRSDVIGKNEIIGKAGCLGILTKIGPIHIESYVSDREPEIEKSKFFRFIHWQPLIKEIKEGWFLDKLPGSTKQIGIATINNPQYWQDWSDHANRHRKKWLQNNAYEIIETDFDKFAKAYHRSKKLDWLIRSGFLRILKYQLATNKENIHFFTVQKKDTEEISAGLVVTDYPDISQTSHTISFFSKQITHPSAGVGLIDYWYKHALKNKIKFLNFGLVWKKGDSRAWKGYSKFKKQFNLYLIKYPHPVFKFILPW